VTNQLDPGDIRQIDRQSMSSLILSWPEQIESQSLRLAEAGWPDLAAAGLRQCLLGGMGGSAIAGDVVYGVAEDSFALPFRVVRDYRWPGGVDARTLCLLSSYSGNTEETLGLYDEAGARGAVRRVLTSGGELMSRARRDGVPVVTLPPGLPPRAALGYSVVSVLGLFRSLGWQDAEGGALGEAQEILEAGNRLFAPEIGEPENPAKQLARALNGHAVVIYTPVRHLHGVGLRWKGQINENAKQLAFHADLPELDHNEIVGWEVLRDLHSRFRVVFPRDHHEHPRVARRIELTRGILAAEGVESLEVHSRGRSRLARLVSLIQIGDWVSLYLAALAGVDPTNLEKLDRLKRTLEESD
jgi:glucose/mannose-6-phosphate isomerase